MPSWVINAVRPVCAQDYMPRYIDTGRSFQINSPNITQNITPPASPVLSARLQRLGPVVVQNQCYLADRLVLLGVLNHDAHAADGPRPLCPAYRLRCGIGPVQVPVVARKG